MAVSVIMPRQGQSVESCILTEWKKKVGDPVKTGDILFSYETDKASFEEEAKADGTLLAVFFKEQDDIPCLEEVAVIGDPGEDISGFGKGTAAPAAEKAADVPAAAPAPAAAAPVERSKDATAVIMPRQGQSVESCILTEWKKKVGEEVHAGDILFSYETDKASFEEEAKVDGTLLAVFFKEQDDIPCLEEVAVIGKPGTSVAGFGPAAAQAPAETAPAAETAQAPAAEKPAAEAAAASGAAVTGVSPRARQAAARLGVDISTVSATGPHGRIIERDVMAAKKSTASALLGGSAAGIQGTGIGGRVTLADLAAAAKTEETPAAAPAAAAAPAPAAAPAADYSDVKIPNIRKAIARSMTTSLSTMAQLTLNTSFDATEIVKYRMQLKASEDEKLQKITYNDFLLFAVSRLAAKYPNLNAHWLDKEGVIRQFSHVHIGMAVDTPRGLMVPTIFNADIKSLAQISAEAKALAAECKTGSINPDKLTGASITISNVGAFGIESFTPVINPPQTAILGVCGMTDRVRQGAAGIELYKSMGLSLTIDHRALDGADGSRFLKELCTAMTRFSTLLAL